MNTKSPENSPEYFAEGEKLRKTKRLTIELVSQLIEKVQTGELTTTEDIKEFEENYRRTRAAEYGGTYSLNGLRIEAGNRERSWSGEARMTSRGQAIIKTYELLNELITSINSSSHS